MKFIVEKDGTFYNAELAGLLEIDDPQTSIYLGHLTRKLTTMALSVGGFGGANWYSKVRSSGRTLIECPRRCACHIEEGN